MKTFPDYPKPRFLAIVMCLIGALLLWVGVYVACVCVWVGHGRAQVAQALPRAFLQEAIGDIECRAPPTFDREQHECMG